MLTSYTSFDFIMLLSKCVNSINRIRTISKLSPYLRYYTADSSTADTPWDRWEYLTDLEINKSSMKSKSSDLRSNASDKFQNLSEDDIFRAIEVLSTFCSDTRLQKLESCLAKRTDNVRFIFETPANFNNVWASLRTLDSFGIQYVDIVLKNESNVKSTSHKKTYSSMMPALGTQKWLSLNQYIDVESSFRFAFVFSPNYNF